DADAFAYFKETGIFNPETAARLKRLLSSGGTVDPMELYSQLRGRKPEPEALLNRAGLAGWTDHDVMINKNNDCKASSDSTPSNEGISEPYPFTILREGDKIDCRRYVSFTTVVVPSVKRC